MRDPLNLYKLIVLYMLDNIDVPLTKAQVFDFVMGKGYVTFFSLQQSIGELIDAELIETLSSHNATKLLITDKGRETVGFFGNRIPDNIKAAISEFMAENSMAMRKTTSVSADYFKSTSGEYEVALEVKDKDVTLISINMSVPAKDTAEKICNGWEDKNAAVYEYLLKILQEKNNGEI